MQRWIKITIGVTVTLFVLLIVSGIVFYNILNSSLPEYEGEISNSEISADVQIYRDSMAVPYIIAKTEEDAAFALGYVHAQDRLFVMDIIRRAGEGRLSEVMGEKSVPFDKMFRTVGLKRIADKNIKLIDSKSFSLLNAYSKGINYFIRNSQGKLPAEFDVLGYDPEEWKPEHSLIVGRMMAWELNISWWIDIAFTYLVQKFGEAKIMEILPNYPENAKLLLPIEINKYPPIDKSIVQVDKNFRKLIGMSGTHLGSNNWVVNGKKSDSGLPMIANDTHLHFSAPSRWYAAVIRAGDWNAEGFTIPGAPAVVVGNNQNISWGVTNIMLDDADFFVETLDSLQTHYLFNGEWKPLHILKDTLEVKNKKPIVFEIKSTHRGPIVSDIHPFSVLYPKSKNSATISMKWLGTDYSNELKSFYLMNKAKSWSEFKAAFKDYGLPGQNFVYGDKVGNIGYVFGGRLPIRNNISPTFIYDGTTDKYDWKGIVPINELPSVYNPSTNFLATANNKLVKDFKYHISNIWEPSSRSERINFLLNSKEKHNIDDYKKYQMDVTSPYAEKVVKYILSAFEDIKILDANLSSTIQMLRQWDYEMNEFSQVPTIYAMFLNQFLKNTLLDEMGEDLFNEYVFVANVPYRTAIKILSDSSNTWFDNINTPAHETKNEIIRKSLSDALSDLENAYGKNIANWQWGYAHKVTFKHAFTGASSLLDKFINIGPFNAGGDGTTLFNTEYSFAEGIEDYPLFNHNKFDNVLGPTMRYLFDFAKPFQFQMILTTGQSGNFMSEHYDDMSEMWLRGNYITVRTDTKSITNSKNKLLKIIKK
ncbi:MAG: penicillin acylase family protein [Ignavibacteriaceae bacterium]|nr:penicillin acylase family protein [Ignavibacteriaceae bacterium]